jgi:hypothetical protein
MGGKKREKHFLLLMQEMGVETPVPKRKHKTNKKINKRNSCSGCF